MPDNNEPRRTAQGRGNNPNGGNWNSGRGGQQASANDFYSQNRVNNSWITNGVGNDMVDFADKSGKFMANNGLTNSKIRGVYGEIKRIQMATFEKEKAAFYLLKPKMAYSVGRDKSNQGLILFKKIFDDCFPLVTNENQYKNFCNLIEAILAYHKAYGGKD